MRLLLLQRLQLLQRGRGLRLHSICGRQRLLKVNQLVVSLHLEVAAFLLQRLELPLKRQLLLQQLNRVQLLLDRNRNVGQRQLLANMRTRGGTDSELFKFT